MTRDDETDDETTIWAAAVQTLVQPVAPPPALRNRLLDRLRGPDRYAPFGSRLGQIFDLSDAALADLLRRADRPASWTPGIAPVRRYLDFRPGPRAMAPRAGLVTLAAGCRIPAHRHDEAEVMLVLEGRVTDDRGRCAEPGECIASDPGSAHAVDIGPDSDAVVALLHGRIHLLGV